MSREPKQGAKNTPSKKPGESRAGRKPRVGSLTEAEAKSRPVNLRVLSDYLGLSPTTISLVLNEAEAGRSIPEMTRARVKAAALKLGYRPSLLARSLRQKQSYTIGTLVPQISDTYSTLIMAGVDDVLQEQGYVNFTVSHRRKPDLIEEYPRILMDRSVEGVLAIDTPLASAMPIPVVAVAGRLPIEGVTNIVLDHRRAAELVMRHLYSLGHRDIAYMRGQTHSSDAGSRWDTLMDVGRGLGLKYKPELTVQLDLDLSSPELGYPGVGQLLATRQPFTALVCYNDIAAIGAIRALIDAGLKVPDDVSVVGFDDIQNAAYNIPSLTTIRQPLREMGSIAARVLLNRIRGVHEDGPEITISPELVIRESTLPLKKKK